MTDSVALVKQRASVPPGPCSVCESKLRTARNVLNDVRHLTQDVIHSISVFVLFPEPPRNRTNENGKFFGGQFYIGCGTITPRLNTPGRVQGSQAGSQGLHITGSHGAQDTGSQGSQDWNEAEVIYTGCCVCVVVAVGKSEPERHQLDKPPPLLEQPTLTVDNKRATEKSNANFFMIRSPK